MKYKKESELFWDSCFATSEVRWDFFEEIMVKYAKDQIVVHEAEIDKVDWTSFARGLHKVLMRMARVEKGRLNPEVVYRPGEIEAIEQFDALAEDLVTYPGQIVEKKDFVAFAQKESLQPALVQLLQTTKQEKRTQMHKQVEKDHKHDLIRFICGSFYKGEKLQGLRHGQGRLELHTGDTYTGAFFQGMRQGQGALENADGRFQGEWFQDRRHGYGEQLWEDGSSFKGEWHAGGFKQGVFLWSDGSEFNGEWDPARNQMHGKGVLSLAHEIITGEWRDGKLNGQGSRKTADGELYQGKWLNGKLNGKGEYKGAQGQFSGNFINNKENGFGVKIFEDGSVYKGNWKDGYPNGQGEMIWVEGDKYEGEFIDGEREGKGKILQKNGKTYEGEWKQDQMWGFGTLVMPAEKKEETAKVVEILKERILL